MARGWKYISVLLVLTMVLALGIFALPVTADGPTSEYGGSSGNVTIEGTAAAPEEVNNGIDLLIQDDAPWGVDANHDALDELGVDYDVINSASLATHNLTGYCFIMFASDQRDSYYNNIAANMAKINAYVNGGGLLLAHCCDGGWHGGSWSGFSILPGGVTHVRDSSDTIDIVDPTHGVVTGDGAFTLTEAYLSGWSSSTHGYFTNLASGTNVVMRSPDGPTYIDYKYGKGKVLATMQTIEWGYQWGFGSEFLLNEIRFAIDFCQGEYTTHEREVKPKSAPPRSPAQISSMYLRINPQQTSVGRPVTTTISAVNTGDEAGNYQAALKINGQVEQTMMVSVGPRGAQQIKFTVTKNNPGTYTVDIGGQHGSFTINGTSGTADTPVNSGLLIGLAAVLIIATIVVLVLTLR